MIKCTLIKVAVLLRKTFPTIQLKSGEVLAAFSDSVGLCGRLTGLDGCIASPSAGRVRVAVLPTRSNTLTVSTRVMRDSRDL